MGRKRRLTEQRDTERELAENELAGQMLLHMFLALDPKPPVGHDRVHALAALCMGQHERTKTLHIISVVDVSCSILAIVNVVRVRGRQFCELVQPLEEAEREKVRPGKEI